MMTYNQRTFPLLLLLLLQRTSPLNAYEAAVHTRTNSNDNAFSRRLEDTGRGSHQCLIKYLECLSGEDACAECLNLLDDRGVLWVTKLPDAACSSALKYLYSAEMCKSLASNSDQMTSFCDMYATCAVYDEVNAEYSDDDDAEYADDDEYYDDDEYEKVDCSTLTECKWDGMNPTFIGNSFCNRESCYNTEVCGYDGGDCCEDTCVSRTYTTCGVDGYVCKDPKSLSCNSALTEDCEAAQPAALPPAPAVVSCDREEKRYKVFMYDSWGDGWDENSLVIKNITNGKNSEESKNATYELRLDNGYKDDSAICLKDGCFSASILDSRWADDIAWEIKFNNINVASGKAPMDCTFSVGGNFCENTCNGVPQKEDPNGDKMPKDLRQCAYQKCPIQMGECVADTMSCGSCIENSGQTFCNTDEQFKSLVSCIKCTCTEEKESPVCNKENSTSYKCSSEQMLAGTESVLTYSKCSSIDDTLATLKEWDEHQFGRLDDFEQCAHNFARENRGRALDCMNILASIVRYPVENENNNTAILSIATKLYDSPEEICDCAVESNKICPDCKKFSRFKTLLHETLDACESVDEVDCASWEEFVIPCKANLQRKFGTIDFSKNYQCSYVKEADCGNVGAFPTFRRLDCEGEISDEAWSFFKYMVQGCSGDNGGDSAPQVVAPVIPYVPAPTKPRPYPQPHTKAPTKPYVPPEDRDKKHKKNDDKSDSSSSKKSGHGGMILGFVFLSAGVGGYVYYKRRAGTFSYPVYQKPPSGYSPTPGNNLFAGLSMNVNEASNTSYQPVHVPGGDTL